MQIHTLILGVISVNYMLVPFPFPTPCPNSQGAIILVLRSTSESEQTAQQTTHIVKQTEHIIYDR